MLSKQEIEELEFTIREVIRLGKHSGDETFFLRVKATIEKLKKESRGFVPMRKKAMKWWNNLSLGLKFHVIAEYGYAKGLGATWRQPKAMTGREIEDVYCKIVK